MSNRKKGRPALSRKKMAALIGGVVGVVLIAWIVLMVSIFGKGKPKKNETLTPEEKKIEASPTPTPPETLTVFRLSKEYRVTKDGRKWLQCVYDYDEFGRMTEKTEYSEDDQVVTTDKVTYDDSDRITEIVHTYRLSEVEEITDTKLSYFPQGGLQEIVTYDNNGEITDQRVYNEKGKMIRHEWSDYDYDCSETYNDNGDIILNQRIFPNGEVSIEEENVYSEDGLLLESVSERNGTKDIYSYDASGMLTKKQSYQNGNLFSETVYYPMNNDEIHSDEHVFTDDGYYYITDHYEFDKDGRVLRYTLYNHGGGIEENTGFEYDSEGRLTRREVYDEEFNLSFGFDYEYNDLSERLGEYTKCVTWEGPKRNIKQWYETEYCEDEGIPSRVDSSQYYNTHGNQVTAILSLNHLNDAEKTKIGFYYEMDSNGNPSRKITLDMDGNETLTGEREYVQLEIKNRQKQ